MTITQAQRRLILSIKNNKCSKLSESGKSFYYTYEGSTVQQRIDKNVVFALNEKMFISLRSIGKAKYKYVTLTNKAKEYINLHF